LGTLRSHPSVQFAPRDSFKDVADDKVVKLITELSDWLSEHSASRGVGPVVQAYFEDMYEVWRGQRRLLAEDGVAVCVLANSTFAQRERQAAGDRLETLRVPLLTDVLLAHLAKLSSPWSSSRSHRRPSGPFVRESGGRAYTARLRFILACSTSQHDT
jgi:hypothetical protein